MHFSAPLKRLAYPMHHTYILVISYLNKEWKRYIGNISLYLLSSWNDDVPICRSILCGTLCILKFLMLLRQYLARSVQFIPAYKRYQWLFHTTHTHTVWWIKCPQNIEGLCMRLNMRKWASLTGGCVSERVCAGVGVGGGGGGWGVGGGGGGWGVGGGGGCKPYPWFTRITCFVWRFDAHWVIAMDIAIRHGYFGFRVALRPRIMQSARDIAPLAQFIISIFARIASWNKTYHYYGFRAPGAVSVMTHRNPKGELPLWQAIFTGGSKTYPAHSGYKLCLVYSRMPLRDAIIEPEYDRVW